MIRRKYIIYKNKIFQKILIHLCSKKNYFFTTHIVDNIIFNIQREFLNVSPIYIIEKAIFNILLPIKHNKFIYDKSKLNLIGVSLKYAITKTIISIIRYNKIQFKKSVSDKIALIFIQIYKKEHTLFKNKHIYLSSLLNI